jgi:hypothetical protein
VSTSYFGGGFFGGELFGSGSGSATTIASRWQLANQDIFWWRSRNTPNSVNAPLWNLDHPDVFRWMSVGQGTHKKRARHNWDATSLSKFDNIYVWNSKGTTTTPSTGTGSAGGKRYKNTRAVGVYDFREKLQDRPTETDIPQPVVDFTAVQLPPEFGADLAKKVAAYEKVSEQLDAAARKKIAAFEQQMQLEEELLVLLLSQDI